MDFKASNNITTEYKVSAKRTKWKNSGKKKIIESCIAQLSVAFEIKEFSIHEYRTESNSVRK